MIREHDFVAVEFDEVRSYVGQPNFNTESHEPFVLAEFLGNSSYYYESSNETVYSSRIDLGAGQTVSVPQTAVYEYIGANLKLEEGFFASTRALLDFIREGMKEFGIKEQCDFNTGPCNVDIIVCKGKYLRPVRYVDFRSSVNRTIETLPAWEFGRLGKGATINSCYLMERKFKTHVDAAKHFILSFIRDGIDVWADRRFNDS